MSTIIAQLKNIKRLIETGEGVEAAKELGRLKGRKMPREAVSQVANLARRTGMPDWSLRLLCPIVRTLGKIPTTPTVDEKMEYAAALIVSGLEEEGLALLEPLDTKANPEVLLFRSFGQVCRWDYRGSIPLLEEYVVSPKISEYSKCVGEANLIAALLTENECERAAVVLKSLQRKLESQSMKMLQGNVLQLAAQIEIKRGNWSEAEAILARSEGLLRNTTDHAGAFMVRRWKTVLRIEKSGWDAKYVAEVDELRREATERSHWEIVRDCDRMKAILLEDRDLLLYVYFGTPFESFRKKLLQDFAWNDSLPDIFPLRMGAGDSQQSPPVIDLLTGAVEGTSRRLKVGHISYRLLSALASDFYRPFRLGSLHRLLHPNEFYNPASAHLKVHISIDRLRRWLKQNRLPLRIMESRSEYRLIADEPIILKIRKSSPDTQEHHWWLEKVVERFGDAPFTSTEASKIITTVSYRTLIEKMTAACEKGLLTRIGRGRSTRYRLTTRVQIRKEAA